MSKAKSKVKQRKPGRKELTPEEARNFLRIVRDDLEFLKALDFARPSRTAVRVASSILRRLLHEGMYANGWRLAGFEGQPNFTAVDLLTAVENIERRYIHYAYAGGASTEGAQHEGLLLLVIPKAEVQVEGAEAVNKRVYSKFKPRVKKTFSLEDFCNSPCVLSGDAGVSRVGVIRYVANKLGGVHWDNERGTWTDPVGARHRLLDEEHLIVGRLPGVLYEIVSTAEAVATSPDTLRFIEKVKEIAPEDEANANVIRFREWRIGKYADMTFHPRTQNSGEAQSQPSPPTTQ